MRVPNYLSKSAFAARIGRSPSYITRLKDNGRLVLSPNGKLVDVLTTETLIRTASDPCKADVAARHQQEQLQRDVYSELSPHDFTAAPPRVDPALGNQSDFQKARTLREHYSAQMAEMEFRKAEGALVEISVVQTGAFQVTPVLNESLLNSVGCLAHRTTLGRGVASTAGRGYASVERGGLRWQQSTQSYPSRKIANGCGFNRRNTTKFCVSRRSVGDEAET